jgi:CRP-like cAMP-binding protein
VGPYLPPRFGRERMAGHEPAHTLDLIGAVPLFAGLSKGQLKLIAKTAKDRSIRAGETIVKHGEQGVGLFIILDGEVAVEKAGKSVAQLGPGKFFGEMALIDDQPRTADVKAVTPVRCLVLSRWEFWSAVGTEPEVIRSLLVETVRRLRASNAGATD